MIRCDSEKESECISVVEGLMVENKNVAGGLGVALLFLQVVAFKLARRVVKVVKMRSQKND